MWFEIEVAELSLFPPRASGQRRVGDPLAFDQQFAARGSTDARARNRVKPVVSARRTWLLLRTRRSSLRWLRRGRLLRRGNRRSGTSLKSEMDKLLQDHCTSNDAPGACIDAPGPHDLWREGAGRPLMRGLFECSAGPARRAPASRRTSQACTSARGPDADHPPLVRTRVPRASRTGVAPAVDVTIRQQRTHECSESAPRSGCAGEDRQQVPSCAMGANYASAVTRVSSRSSPSIPAIS